MSQQSVAQPVNSAISTMSLSPTHVVRGRGVIGTVAHTIAALGDRPLVIGGDRTLTVAAPFLSPLWEAGLVHAEASYGHDCSAEGLARLKQAVADHQANLIIGVGGGKALDAAKLVAYESNLPIVTLPTSAATCAAWTALSNVYSEQGAFLYDVALPKCPDMLILDYDLVQLADRRTLVAGIGDALAKWYEASVSSGHVDQTLIIAAVQQARVLRDILFQKSEGAIAHPGSQQWCDVVDASVLLAGVIGGLGGAQCRTVAAHAVHNGLTHLLESHGTLHGEKVAYGILVQLRLEEMIQGNQLAAAARHQLLKFYQSIGLPCRLHDLGLGDVSLSKLEQAATVACLPKSDIHHLPFDVTPTHVVAAMVSTTVESHSSSSSALSAGASGSESHTLESADSFA
ncbi:MAG: iron-containing alcohol dehydrogenase family protein [Leptolyngbyaceae bacterium]|nr:iron-containing alcohol dehydrogenase family protein [Leptolyngbyaceae bacterium]